MKKELEGTLGQLKEEHLALWNKMREQEEHHLQVGTREELCSVQVEEHKNIMHNMEEQQKMTDALGLQNHVLKEQPAQMQDSFQRLVRVHCSPGSSPPRPSRQSSTLTLWLLPPCNTLGHSPPQS